MTGEQERFTIKRIEKYEQEISYEKKETVKKAFCFAFWALLATYDTIQMKNRVPLSNLLNMSTSFGFLSYNLKGLIESISRKTMLEGKVEDLNFELNMEIRGRQR